MKITAFNPDYSTWLAEGVGLDQSSGSNSGFGPDVEGDWADLSVVGLRQIVSLASNMGDNTVGTVLTTVQSSPWVAQFAAASNSIGSNAMLKTTGGYSRATTIAASGTAQTLMVGGANYWDITLNANCTFGFTGWAPSGYLSEIGVRLTEDGTGGWTPSFPTVTWLGTTPTHDTTAGSSTEYVFWTDDGGSTILGGQLGTAISYGSNATRVSEVSGGGAAASVSRSDHRHDGIGTITASSSNTMQRGTWNLRPGTGIALALSDTDGDGEFDTTTIVNTAGAGGGGGGASNLVSSRIVRTNGTTGTYTTTSATFADIDATNLSITLTTGARRCLVTFTCMATNTGALNNNEFDIVIDGTRYANTTLGLVGPQTGTNNLSINIDFSIVTDVLSAGSHTFKPQFATSAGTLTVYQGTTTWPVTFSVTELYAV